MRLTALYTLLFGGSAALLMALSWWLLGRHLERTLPAGLADEALADLGIQYVLAFVGTTVLAVALGWAMAGRALAPLARVTRAAREVSDERLSDRIGLTGPDDEVRELADTFDAMLDRLSSSFEAQRRFVANASHELRSPLTLIRSEAEVALADPQASAAELRTAAEGVVEATERTEALLEGLLALARSQRGLMRSEPVDLASSARAASAQLGREAAAREVGLRLDARPAPTAGDRWLLDRLVSNLVENAVRHNHRGGWAEVVTGVAAGCAFVRVRNGGRRIDPDAAPRLAEPFERTGRRSDGRGAGLGLSIVASVAEAHGGELRIEVRSEGGLVAEVSVPAATAAADPPAGPAGAALDSSAAL